MSSAAHTYQHRRWASNTWGLSQKKPQKKAVAANKFPFPVFRVGGQKSGWFVDAQVLADYLDAQIEKAKKEYKIAR